ncbi:uncharacterized protein KY384_003947 [Bacidia gigantensis]|uniref:uncharacterized protein n=1 Tax=Bacidia gigantensis TaxID=2732470 RepID=UPI001D03ADE3|nr:uncharacterized protein KY384_003947 [Bacidia gigantensis]KAG8532306.1 hypothetical protein KY384_003947 [Bacidia gigantensis]
MVDNCATCGKDARLTCNGCLKAPSYLDDPAHATKYCGAECQKKHWPTHKKRCKTLQNRKSLYRAASLIQEIYYVTRRRTWGGFIEKILRVDDETVFVHMCRVRKGDKNSWIQKPPYGMIGTTLQDEYTLLAMNGCQAAIVTMGPSVEVILKSERNLIIGMHEYEVRPMGRKLWDVQVRPDGSIDQARAHHTVFTLHLSLTERYALDLTHAQYGHQNDTLTPWKTYLDTRVHSTIDKPRPVGYTNEKNKIIFAEIDNGDYATRQVAFEGVLRQAVTSVPQKVDAWSKIWQTSDEAAHHLQRDRIIGIVTTSFDKFIASTANTPLFQIWNSQAMYRGMVAMGKREYENKVKDWGEDGRGRLYPLLVDLVKKWQASDKKGEWAPRDEGGLPAGLRIDESGLDDPSYRSEAAKAVEKATGVKQSILTIEVGGPSR